jgi:hypothetical protein
MNFAAVLSGLLPEDIKACYPIENLRNMASSYLSRLQTANRDIFASYKDVKYTFRKFKTLQRRS